MENLPQELLEKAKRAKSAEELLILAKENGMEMTEEEAKAYYAQLNPVSGEIADDELENVAGGGCHSKDGRLVVTTRHSCDFWTCICGNTYTTRTFVGRNMLIVCSRTGCGRVMCCENCQHMSYEGGLWLCNNPANNNKA